MNTKKGKPQPGSFEEKYPNISDWVLDGRYIEIGQNGSGYTTSFTRALDLGGMAYEGATEYKSIDEALQALDDGIKAWLVENG